MIIENDWRANYSQIDKETDYITWAKEASSCVDFTGQSRVCILNCSEGPSARGLVAGVSQTSLTAELIISDISPYAVSRCARYLLNAYPDRVILPVICSTEYIAQVINSHNSIHKIDSYVALEPIGDMESAFDRISCALAAGGKIVVCSRSCLDLGIRALVRSHFRHDSKFSYAVYTSKTGTQSGLVMAVELTKLVE